MTNFYSQNGEDIIIDDIFRDQPEGVFIEIGCIDGRRFSNTLRLEERGWKGLCIEAHGDYIESLTVNRPNSIVCHCAVAEKDSSDVEFYANSRGSLSTLDKSREYEFRKKYGTYFTGFVKQSVDARTLTTIFDDNRINSIDFLSLDIEGYEVEAIKGLDLERFKPEVMLIESDSEEHERQLDKLLIKTGYLKPIKVKNNIFYVRNKRIAERIRKKNYGGTITHTQHPLDSDGDKMLKTLVDKTNY